MLVRDAKTRFLLTLILSILSSGLIKAYTPDHVWNQITRSRQEKEVVLKRNTIIGQMISKARSTFLSFICITKVVQARKFCTFLCLCLNNCCVNILWNASLHNPNYNPGIIASWLACFNQQAKYTLWWYEL